jgi:hypothetical protein
MPYTTFGLGLLALGAQIKSNKTQSSERNVRNVGPQEFKLALASRKQLSIPAQLSVARFLLLFVFVKLASFRASIIAPAVHPRQH